MPKNNFMVEVLMEPYTRKYGVKLVYEGDYDYVINPTILDDEVNGIFSAIFHGDGLEFNKKSDEIYPLINVPLDWINSFLEMDGKKIIENETFVSLSKLANEETRKDYVGIPCGISAVDKYTTGLNKSDLIIIGARPGMGKTSFCLNIARNVAVNSGKTVCFFSLEMTRDQLAQRMLSNEACIKSEKLRTGELSEEDFVNLGIASERLSKAPIYFDETSGITVPEIKAKVRRMNGKCDVVMIDYLGLLRSTGTKENRVQEVSEITRNLKIMAKELQIPVVCCAQLNRGTEGKGGSHIPALSDLRESGSIEQDADIVLFLHREGYYASSDGQTADQNKAQCIIAKNRHGETATVDLHWDGQFTRFSSQDVFH